MPLPAQAPAPAQRVKLVSLTFDHWRGWASGPWLLRPTLRLTRYSPRRPGVELAAVMFPDGISIYPPAVLLDLQAGLVQPVAAGPVTFLPRAGLAAVTAAGLLSDTDLIRIAPGIQAGLGILIPVDRKSALRLDVTRHLYDSPYERFGVWSFGFGVSGGLRRPSGQGKPLLQTPVPD
jgi:hypothetical protein